MTMDVPRHRRPRVVIMRLLAPSVLAFGCVLLVAGLASLCPSPALGQSTSANTLDIFSPDIDLIFENFTVDQGLPENSVRAILQDRSGFLWFGTMNGLVRYDGIEMKVFGPSTGDTLSFGGRTVMALHEDDAGKIWIGTYSSGLWKYDSLVGAFTHVPLGEGDRFGGETLRVNDINQDSEGHLWVAMQQGLASIDLETGEITWHDGIIPPDQGGTSVLGLQRVYPDDQGRIWLATKDNGVMVYEPRSGSLRHLVHDPDQPRSLPTMTAYGILQTREGKIWLATTDGISLWQEATGDFITYRADSTGDHDSQNLMVCLAQDDRGLLWIGAGAGLYVFDPGSHRFRHFSHDFERPTSPVNGPVLSILIDRSGILWGGSWHAGLNKVDPNSGGFRSQGFSTPDQGTGGLWVDAVFEDSQGGLWVGTSDTPSGLGQGGLFHRPGPDQGFRQIAPGPGQPMIPPVRSIMENPDGSLWVGTYRGLWQLKQGRLSSISLGSSSASTALDESNIHEIVLGPEGVHWFGTWTAGLFRWDSRTGELVNFSHELLDPHSISSNEVISLLFDHAGRLWVGTDSNGMNLFRPESDGFQRFFEPEIGLGNINGILEGSGGDLWLATLSGLLRFDPATGTTEVFGRDQGLPNNQVASIEQDDAGRFWISTGYGLARFDPESHQVKKFDVLDGLLDNEVKFASLKDSQGHMHFGGRTGLISFDPASFKNSTYQPDVVITGLKLSDTLLTPGPDSPLEREVHLAEMIELGHDQNHLAFTFASLDFARPNQIRYRYMLEGLDPNWRILTGEPRATYTNLSPGTYTFRVGGTNRDGIWSDRQGSLVIRVLPPWWKTWWAYLLYVFSVLGVVLIILRQVIMRERMRAKLEFQRAEAVQLQELDQFKSRFLTNITHEFRTPLTLIKTPLLKLKSDQAKPDDGRFDPMIRNTERLEQLIDQLLDLSRIEAGRLPLNWQKGDCLQALSTILADFQALAAQRRIKLQLEIPDRECLTWFDEDLGEKLVNNLVSNALKFTPEGGRVTITAAVSDEVTPLAVPRIGRRSASGNTAPGRWFTITVANSGTYIPPQEQTRIFDRFYQASTGGGSGVGLAFVKELTQWLGGAIDLESSPVSGTVFTARLPLFEHHPEDGPEPETAPGTAEATIEQADDSFEVEFSLEYDEPRILVVEDHPELRDFITKDLFPEYRVLVAENGKEGLDLAVAEIPDLVLSDIMMPVMDGFELCRRLKDDERTSHIPVILLTARSEAESRHQGLNVGADDYVVKPFDGQDLRLRIKNLISQRRKLAEIYERRLALLTPDVMPVTSADERFVAHLRSVINANLGDTEFKINALCQEVGMSRSQLHRKLRAVTGMSASDFVRSHRIQRAAQLFKGGYGNVTEVAYAVGFRNLSHFSRSFKDLFDVNPSEYLKNAGEQDSPQE